jgi:hypothetical protein
VNYTKRKRRAAEKRDLLKWRCCEIYYGNFEEVFYFAFALPSLSMCDHAFVHVMYPLCAPLQLYWSSGMSRKKGGFGHRHFEGSGPNYFEGYRKQKSIMLFPFNHAYILYLSKFVLFMHLNIFTFIITTFSVLKLRERISLIIGESQKICKTAS